MRTKADCSKRNILRGDRRADRCSPFSTFYDAVIYEAYISRVIFIFTNCNSYLTCNLAGKGNSFFIFINGNRVHIGGVYLQKILGALRRAVDDYGMINESDRIGVGVSGGKDSMVLLAALHGLSEFYPKKFSVVGINLDIGLPGFDISPVADYCALHGIEFVSVRTEIYRIVFDERRESNPCSLCARMRRGRLHSAAIELGCNKLALGHHNDDVLETMLLNLLFEGRIGCFSPVTYLSRKDITVIRPLVYLRERDIRGCIRRNSLPVCEGCCIADGHTQRQSMKELLGRAEKEFPKIRQRMFGALQRSGLDGWTPFRRRRDK